jgi:hypothetical protein
MRTGCLLASIFAIAPPLVILAQEIPIGTLDRDRITAGKTFHLTVRLSEPPNYSSHVQQVFTYKSVNGIPSPQQPVIISCDGETKPASRDVELQCSVPTDADGGIYEAQRLFGLWPPPGASRQREFKIQVPDIEVVPVPDTNVYPTTAVATISLDQKQILHNGAEKIGFILDQLNTKVDERSAETRVFRTYLSGVAGTARAELQKIRTQYEGALDKGKPEPIFFEDFDRQFQAFIIEANAPPIGSNVFDQPQSAHLERVQLSDGQSVIVRPTPFDGALGPYLTMLVNLLVNLRDGLRMIADAGSDTFTISLKSTPPGAAISYRRVGEKYQDYSSATDVEQASFPYAMWTFRFTIGHCEVVRFPNPYIEKSPNLNVSMLNCSKR